MAVLETFSTPIWRIETTIQDEINNEFLNIIPSLRADKDNSVSRSNAGGRQSKMLDARTIPVFQSALISAINEINSDLKIKPNTNIFIDSLWININSKHHYNQTHTHPNSMISGVYYVTVPENSGDLILLDPRPQTATLLLPVTEKSKFTALEVRHKPTPGTFVLFPSWMPHFVEASDTDEERISVAFNVALMEAQ